MGDKDQMEKTLEAYNDVFADIVNALVFGGRQVVSEQDLTDHTPHSYYKAAGKVRGQERDIAKRWEKGGVCFSCIGIENQTSPDPDMPIRVMSYDAAVYRDQLGKNKSRRHYPVISLVLYLGYEERWTGPFRLKECLDIPEELNGYISDYTTNVFPIAWLTRDQVERFHSDFRVVADYYVQKRENGNYEPNPQTLLHAREVMHLLSAMERDERFETAYNSMLASDPDKEECNMCDVIDRFIEKGRAFGIEEGMITGRAEGADQERARNVRALAAAGHSDVEIATWLQLDLHYVESVLAG